MSASAASLNMESPFAPIGQKVDQGIIQVEEGVTSLLDKVVRLIAGKDNLARPSNLSEATLSDLHSGDLENGLNPETTAADSSATFKPKNIRYHIAKEFFNIAHNSSNLVDRISAVLSTVYMVGGLFGRPMAAPINLARRVDQTVNLTRRFATGMRMNSIFRMAAAFLGIPAAVVSDPGEGMYLKKGFESFAGNLNEGAVEAATHDGTFKDGKFENLMDEPKALVKKLGGSLLKLAKNPSLITNMEFLKESQLLDFGNILGTGMLAKGMKSENNKLARDGRELESTSVDFTKAISDNPLRALSSLFFLGEMGCDGANEAKYAGDSTRLSAMTALTGLMARTFGVVYPDFAADKDGPKIYSNPLKFIAQSVPHILRFGNPAYLATKQNKSKKDEFENSLYGKPANNIVEFDSKPFEMKTDEEKLLTAAQSLAKAPEFAKASANPSSYYDVEDYVPSASSRSASVSSGDSGAASTKPPITEAQLGEMVAEELKKEAEGSRSAVGNPSPLNDIDNEDLFGSQDEDLFGNQDEDLFGSQSDDLFGDQGGDLFGSQSEDLFGDQDTAKEEQASGLKVESNSK